MIHKTFLSGAFSIFAVIVLCRAREGRQLIFQNSGVFKLLVGVGIPVELNKKGASLNWLGNIQAMYKLPENIKFLDESIIRDGKSMKNDINGDLFYSSLRNVFVKFDLPDLESFQRLMCEVNEMRFGENNGLLEDILEVIVSQTYSSSTDNICNRNMDQLDISK